MGELTASINFTFAKEQSMRNVREKINTSGEEHYLWCVRILCGRILYLNKGVAKVGNRIVIKFKHYTIYICIYNIYTKKSQVLSLN